MLYLVLIAVIAFLGYKSWMLARDLRDMIAIFALFTDGITKGRRSETAAKEYVAALSELDWQVWNRFWSKQAKGLGIPVEYEEGTVSDETALKVARAQMRS